MKNILPLIILLFHNACNETTLQKAPQTVINKPVVDSTNNDEIVKSSAKDKTGQSLEMIFNNTKDIATLVFKGDTIQLAQQRSGSGIWYQNNQYDLRGKGDDIELSKDGKIIFINH
ncbi:MAG: hypothetical protein EAZ35_11160 [Sphingobacteriia bacterium]|nr:MAG: hypothetical protein EAZ41_05445 [Sphingobacteriia bacterium]TAG29282.1 MAG: hypothetical protein EAZ35_11160 [Sphingobacteriia bacterium]